MILHHWQGHAPNFGDELNGLLWPHLLPGFFDGRPEVRFLGIGSILDARHPPRQIKVVAGSGYAGYEAKPRLDNTWIIHWVRGPLTARALGLPDWLALGDPASLLPQAVPCPAGQQTGIGFIPHFESLSRGLWQRAASLAGLTLIDPRNRPEAVIAAIGQCRLVLSESLHGAIVADALRVPWIPLRPLVPIHRAKWGDWAGTLELSLRPQRIGATCGAEWLAASQLARRRTVRRILTRFRDELNALCPERLLNSAAEGLRRAAATEPHLSPNRALDRSRTRMLDAIVRLRREPMAGAEPRATSVAVPTGLHLPDNSAYQLRPAG